jgi:hypothetical protein
MQRRAITELAGLLRDKLAAAGRLNGCVNNLVDRVHRVLNSGVSLARKWRLERDRP